MIAGIDDCVAKVNHCVTHKKQKIVALVGAGFSCNASAEFPLWNEISEWVGNVFNKKLGGKRPNSVLGNEADDFTVAAEWYFYMLGKHPTNSTWNIPDGKEAFISTVKTELESASKHAELKAHEALLNKFDTIYTTNWDCLLEKTLDSMSLPYKKYLLRPTHGTSGGKWTPISGKTKAKGPTLKKVIKYHGCCQDSDGWSIVASRTDYDNRLLRVSDILRQGNASNKDYDKQLSESVPVLVGYSYKDINVRFVFSQVHMVKPKLKALNIVVDNPAHYSTDRLEFFKNIYGIETLFLFPEGDEYHKLRGRWEYAIQHKGRGGDEKLLQGYKREMIDYSRDNFETFFSKL